MIGIIGAKGNMGRRYRACLHYLRKTILPIDVDNYLTAQYELCDGFIIATPTETHVSIVKDLAKFGKPILCEKPVSKNLAEILDLQIICNNIPFNMVNQYEYLGLDRRKRGHSYYDYYNHGKDGLKWDCIQIIGQATSTIELRETSPIWKCVINGQPLSISQMDTAYLSMLIHWMEDPGQSFSRIYDIHKKVSEFQID